LAKLQFPVVNGLITPAELARVLRGIGEAATVA
jgi:hypothetical protein